jgi:hypothetical protein
MRSRSVGVNGGAEGGAHGGGGPSVLRSVCGGTAPKLAAVPALSVPAVLCRRNLCGRLDGLDDHLAAIVSTLT